MGRVVGREEEGKRQADRAREGISEVLVVHSLSDGRQLLAEVRKFLEVCAYVVCISALLFPSSSRPTTRPTDACLLLAFKPQSPSCIATSIPIVVPVY